MLALSYVEIYIFYNDLSIIGDPAADPCFHIGWLYRVRLDLLGDGWMVHD